MKKLFTLMAFVVIVLTVSAQVPSRMSYQCVVRNSSGELVPNQAVGMKISILQGSVTGTVVFSETYSPNPQTNANGLVTVEIGSGTATVGSLSDVSWSSGTYFLKTETDPEGGTDYTITGTSQLLSVPYAMHARSAENVFSGNYNDLINKPVLFSGSYPDLTNKPALFSGNYNDLTNQPVLFDGTWSSLSGKPAFSAVATSGSYNDLLDKPVLFDGTWTSLSGKPALAAVATSGLFSDLLSKPTTLAGYGITDADNSNNNELQTLSLSGTLLSLSLGGGTVTLPSSGEGGDNWGTQVVVSNSTLTGSGTTASPLAVANTVITPSWSNIQSIPAGFADGTDNVDDADNSITNEIQVLSLNGTDLTLSNGGGSVTLPSSEGGDNWGTQTVITDATLTGNGTTATPLRIADNGVTSAKIADGAVGTADLASNSVTTAKIIDATISSYDLADNAIITSKIAGNAVTVAKLPAGATASTYLRGDGTWATPSTSTFTETDPTWSGDANQIGNIGRTGNVGIGTATPGSKLEVAGQVKITGGSPGVGKVLTSDATGLASWQESSGSIILPYTGSTSASFAAFQITNTHTDEGTAGIGIYGLGKIGVQGSSTISDGYSGYFSEGKFYAEGNVGIGTHQPSAKLEVAGQVKITGGSPGAGKVLMSDATGLASWQTPAAGGLTLPYEGSVTSAEPAFEVINNAEGTATGEGTAISARTKSSTGRALYGYASSETGITHGVLGSSDSNQGTGVQGTAYSTAGTTVGVKGVVYSATGYSGFFDGGWFYVNGNVGIGKHMPEYKLDVKGNSRIQLTKSDGSWLAMRTDGSLLDFSFSGTNLAIKSDNEGENILLNPASGNKVGVRTWTPQYDLDVNGTIRSTGTAVFSNMGIGDATPDASLDVEGTVVIGSAGKVFSEIREITGNLDADGVCPVNYPSGYTNSNMRVLSLEINYNGDAWVGLSSTDMPATNIMKVFYCLSTSNILIYYPNVVSFHNKAFRMLVMKVQ